MKEEQSPEQTVGDGRAIQRPAAEPRPEGGHLELVTRTATDLVAMTRRGDVSVTEVLEAHLTQIEAVNGQINAVVALDPERARTRARQLDERFTRDRDTLPALYGLPIAHKDVLPVRDWRWTSGSTLFADRIGTVDHIIVEREKAAGAVTIGMTNVPELGPGAHTVNPVYGKTHNPWDLTRSAAGSSGGAAAALAARMLPIADGSDTGGSLRLPASFCHVVGLRSTVGTVPSWPDSLPWTRLSVKGPMARNVRDLYLLLSVQAGDDPRVPVGYGAHFDGLSNPMSLKGVRAAWSLDLGLGLPVESAVENALAPVIDRARSSGVRIEQDCPDLSGAADAFGVIRAWTFEALMGPLVERHRDQLGAKIVWNVELGQALTGPDVARAELHCAVLAERMREFFARYDFLLCPVSQVEPFDGQLDYPQEIDGVPMHNYLEWMTIPSVITMTGCPALSLPAGFSAGGRPVGLQIVGPPRSEQRLLEFALGLEEVFEVADKMPALQPKTGAASCPDADDQAI